MIRISGLIALLLMVFNSVSGQSPYLGDSFAHSKFLLDRACKNLSDHEVLFFNNNKACEITEKKDTLIFQVSSDDQVLYTYVYQNDLCASIIVQYACPVCLNLSDRKWLFKGEWRRRDDGFLYNNKISAQAYIKRAVNCPYLYEIKVTKLNEPIPKEEFKKMERVRKRHIGSRKYLLGE
jgi:hypothetical protein